MVPASNGMRERGRVRFRAGPLHAVLALLLPPALLLSGCQGQRLGVVDNDLRSGDELVGRLAPEAQQQGFTFDGVRASRLSFNLMADCPDAPYPDLWIRSPSGRMLDFECDAVSRVGARRLRVRDHVLPETGTYLVTVAKPADYRGDELYYHFEYALEFPPTPAVRANLRAGEVHTLEITAPRGSLVAIRTQPAPGSEAVPVIEGVLDPRGGRALDKRRTPPGAHPPRLSEGQYGLEVLTFTAPESGRYTVMVSAAPGCSGPAILGAGVGKVTGGGRAVVHGGSPARYGVVSPSRPPAATRVAPTRPVPPRAISPRPIPPRPGPPRTAWVPAPDAPPPPVALPRLAAQPVQQRPATPQAVPAPSLGHVIPPQTKRPGATASQGIGSPDLGSSTVEQPQPAPTPFPAPDLNGPYSDLPAPNASPFSSLPPPRPTLSPLPAGPHPRSSPRPPLEVPAGPGRPRTGEAPPAPAINAPIPAPFRVPSPAPPPPPFSPQHEVGRSPILPPPPVPKAPQPLPQALYPLDPPAPRRAATGSGE